MQDVQPLAREPLHLQLNLTREDGDGLKSTQIRRRPVRSVASGLFTHSDPVSPSPTPSPVSYNAPRTALYDRVYVIAQIGHKVSIHAETPEHPHGANLGTLYSMLLITQRGAARGGGDTLVEEGDPLRSLGGYPRPSQLLRHCATL